MKKTGERRTENSNSGRKPGNGEPRTENENEKEEYWLTEDREPKMR
jgi:hypothetical protein